MFDLPPGACSPPPKVTSSIVNLIPKPDVDLSILPALEKITHAAFGQRRKMIRSSLGSLFAVDDLSFLGIKETARAEELLLEQFIKLARNFK